MSAGCGGVPPPHGSKGAPLLPEILEARDHGHRGRGPWPPKAHGTEPFLFGGFKGKQEEKPPMVLGKPSKKNRHIQKLLLGHRVKS